MTRRFGAAAIAALAALLCQAGQAQDDADRRFAALAAEHWEWYSRDEPVQATLRGDYRYNDLLSDESAEAVAGRKAHWRDLLKQLRSFDPAQLTAENRTSLQVLTRLAVDRTRIDGFFPDLPFSASDFSLTMSWSPITQMYGPQFQLPLLAKSTPFRAVADYEAYLKRLAAVPQLLAQYQARMRVAIEAGWLPAAVALRRVPEQLDSEVTADPAQSPLFLPFSKFPQELAQADRERLTASARQLLAEQVIPAFRDLKQFTVSTYLPAAARRKGLGVSQLPGGRDFYEALIANSTTTSLSAREIHDIGLREVARIRKEMEATIARAGFKGTRAEFIHFLRDSPQFYYDRPEDMLVG